MKKLLLALILLPCSVQAAMQFTPSATSYANTTFTNQNVLYVSSGPRTLAAWFNQPLGAPIGTFGIINFANNVNNFPLIQMDIENPGSLNNLRCLYRDDALNIVETDFPIAVDAKWHHAACVQISTSCYLYYDGVLVSTAGLAGTGSVSINIIAIGALTRAAIGQPWYGKIDDARVYNRALTQAEISTLALSRTRYPLTNGLVGYWPLDNGVYGVMSNGAGTILDRSGNGNNLTPGNLAGSSTGNPYWDASSWLSCP